jgi:hypothetical protein
MITTHEEAKVATLEELREAYEVLGVELRFEGAEAYVIDCWKRWRREGWNNLDELARAWNALNNELRRTRRRDQ